MANASETAICLLSGGLDSATAAAVAKDDGCDLYALTLHYGQRHEREIEAARQVAKALDAREHKILQVPLDAWGGSALTQPDLAVPTGRDEATMAEDIPITYVPARNTIFLSLALAYAEARDADRIYIGANAVDYSGYPDCRPEFLEAFEAMAALGTKRGVEGRPFKIVAPLVHLTKAQIIQLGTRLNVDYGLTWSCYQGGERACGTCDSCVLRLKGFEEAGVADPVAYDGET